MKTPKWLFLAVSIVASVLLFISSCANASYITTTPPTDNHFSAPVTTTTYASSTTPYARYTATTTLPTSKVPEFTPKKPLPTTTTTQTTYATTSSPTTISPVPTTTTPLPTSATPAQTTNAPIPTTITPVPTTASPEAIEIPGLVEAQVVRVIDGDTIEVLLDGVVYDVRYIGIDTPEIENFEKPAEPYGPEATLKNKELVESKTVLLEKDTSETDIYDRLLRYVYIDGLFVNAELVRTGLARVSTFAPDVKYEVYFLQLQKEAKESLAGLWATVYITKTGTKYHLYGCDSLSKSCISIPRAEAIAKGYTPCKVCKP